jgi:TatD DNase family protein
VVADACGLAQFTIMGPLTDIGLNLTHDSFDTDRDEVIQRAEAAGVTRFIITGTSVTQSARALELAKSRPGKFFATAGVHPHHAKEFDRYSSDALRAMLQYPEVVAVGECGLDFYRNISPPQAQETAFAAHLELAAETGLPVFLHQRGAHERFVSMLHPVRDKLAGGVAHCFTGGIDELRPLLDLDLYIGITGWLCDERRGSELRAAVTEIPLNRLLVETDAPYLLPRDLPEKPRTRRNEPSFLPHILRRVAAAIDEPVERVAEVTRRNTERLFSLD